MKKQQILAEYKAKSYLNNNFEKTLVKLFVSYIKPDFLFKTNILTPIHLGRSIAQKASKDGVISDDNIKWLYDNCIGDDNFEGNISHINRRVGFLTGTYWAWKNYEKLGNPQYFGSFGYRKLLPAECLNNLTGFDFIIPTKEQAKPTVKEHLTKLHGTWLYAGLQEAMTALYPEEIEEMEKYFSTNMSYCHEMYIMKKDLFFEYCEWIFPLLEYLLKIDFSKYPREKADEDSLFIKMFELKNEKRDIAYIIERITGYYLYKLTTINTLKYKEYDVVTFCNESENIKKEKDIFFATLRAQLERKDKTHA